MRRSVILVDERDRFLWHHVAYNVLGFPDGIGGAEFRRLGWRHAAAYGVRLLLGHAAGAERQGDRFRVLVERLPEGGPWGHATATVPRDAEMARIFEEVPEGRSMEVAGRTVILATGVFGHFPEFPGRDACVGRSLFWCVHCGGYDSIDRAVAVIGDDDDAVQTALDLLEFTDRVVLVAGREEGFSVPEARLRDLAANGIAAHPLAVREYENEDGAIRALVLEDRDATRVEVEHVYTIRRTQAQNALACQLGVELDARGQIVVTDQQHTNVPGVYAAGDATTLHDHQLTAAAHQGNQAACAANYHLYRPEQRAADDTGCC